MSALVQALLDLHQWAESFTYLYLPPHLLRPCPMGHFSPWEEEPFIHSGWTLPVATVVVYYVLIVQLLPKWMENREPFVLRGPLVAWNFLLFVFSLFCIVSFTVRLYAGVQAKGVEVLICDPDGHFWKGVDLFLVWIFLVSKFVELGDTVFLALRKRRVIFLHWYHHLTVLLYCWQANVTHNSNSILFGTMNALIHTIMYYYYWQTSLGRKLTWGALLTKLQLSQMVFGILFVFSWAYYDRVLGMNCYSTSHDGPLVTSFLMYGSYFVLFGQFYVRRWLANRKAAKASKND